MTLFDANTWIGQWPFAFLPTHTPRSLVADLRRHGIRRALVSPLDAVLAPEPGPANRALLRATQGSGTLMPVPVINPALASWREEFAACAADARVRAVRVLPNYHNYRLTSRAVDELAGELTARGLRLIVNVRLVDERHEYFALRIKGVPTKELGAFLVRHPRLPVLATGMFRPEIRELLPRHARLLADMSFAEWERTVADLLAKVSPRQLVFGSHTPFLITAANTAKLTAAGVPARVAERIAAGNLERFLRE
jgi:predicted TIM-barrel fold metal-dependent hydrolase